MLGGLNFVGVRFSNRELPPFEGAAVRFLIAACIFFVYTRVRGIPLPRGRALLGTLLFGLLAFFGAYALAYWGLVAAPAGMASLAFALVPLITLVLALIHGLESLTARGVLGAVIAAAGIAVVVGDQLAATVPLWSVLALLASVACAAEAGVVVKYFPRSHPAATNAIAMTAGTFTLALLSLAAGETWIVPTQTVTIIAFTFLIASTVGLFALTLYLLGRWTASAVSFQSPLYPLVTVTAAALLAGEGVSVTFLIGGVFVLAGVLLAATARADARRVTPSLRPASGS